MALLHLSYERLLSAIHNENTLDLYFTQGRRLGRLLYEGKWYDPEALYAAGRADPLGCAGGDGQGHGRAASRR